MEYLLKASAITAIFYGFYKLILERETFFQSNRWFLLIGLVSTLVVPLIFIPIYTEQIPLNISHFKTANTNQLIVEQNTFDWIQLLKYSYIIGILILGSKFLLSILSLNKLITTHTKEKNSSYKFIETDKNTSPFSFFNFIVFNPTQFKEEELTQIITHEKVHVKQLHSVDILLSQILVILFWFNPFMWFYKKEIQQNLEFIADDIAQQNTDCETSYQRLLLKSSLPKNQLALTNNFYNSLIKKRIIMLHKNRSKSTNQWKYALILPLIMAFVFTFNTKVIAQNSKVSLILDEDNIEAYVIDKNSTSDNFKKIEKELLKKGVSTKINGIKRNKKGEIMAIKIVLSSENAKSNYSTSSNKESINPIQISVKNNGESITIGNAEKELIVITENLDNELISNKNGNNFIIITEDEDNNKTTANVKIIKSNNQKGSKIFSSNKDKILYFIDEKKASQEDIEDLNPNFIDKMEVLKGETAIKKYGKKAKDGVIIITTKKEK